MKNLYLLLFFLIPFIFIAQTYNVDIQKSNVEWIGEKPTGTHNGNILIKEGYINLDNNKQIKSGQFILDMQSINCTDLTGNSKKSLDGHLKDEDFFNTKNYPIATFIITSASPEKIDGTLTIKDITHNISFTYTTIDTLTYSAEIIIDRTKYNIKYKSKTIFPDLADKFIYDDFTIKLNSLILN